MRKVPVVSLKVNPDNVLNRSSTGFCSGTYERLREDVLRLIRDPNLRCKMGDRARSYAFDNHSEKNAQKIIDILEA